MGRWQQVAAPNASRYGTVDPVRCTVSCVPLTYADIYHIVSARRLARTQADLKIPQGRTLGRDRLPAALTPSADPGRGHVGAPTTVIVHFASAKPE